MKRLFFCFTLLYCFSGFAQFELPKKTIKIAPVSKSSGEVAPISSKSFSYPSIFDKKDKLTENVSLLKKKPEEEKSIFEKEQFIDPAKEYSDKMNNQLKTEGIAKEIVSSDVFLGEFIITTFKLNINCRDFGVVDGDKVAIWLNGEMVVPKIDLVSGFARYIFTVKEGLNTLEIEALNTGELFPNTGQFVFIDGYEKLVTNQQWSLNSGYKAIIKIRKIEGLTVEEKK